MKNNLFYSVLFLTLFFSCNNPTKTETIQAPPPPPKAESEILCFSNPDGKDITAVRLTIKGDSVTGFYAWEPFEKDGARGMLSGKLSDDIITADFTYMIEGSIQSEEVMFKLSSDKLTQAVGELDDKNGTMILKDKAKIEWKDIFNKTDCAKIKASIDNAMAMSEAILKEKK